MVLDGEGLMKSVLVAVAMVLIQQHSGMQGSTLQALVLFSRYRVRSPPRGHSRHGTGETVHKRLWVEGADLRIKRVYAYAYPGRDNPGSSEESA